MRNTVSNRFKVIEKPTSLEAARAQSMIYYDLLQTLDVIAAEKCIQMDKNEIPRQMQNFKSYLQILAKKMNKPYRVAFHFDESKDTLFIWKRDKVHKKENEGSGE